MSIAKSNNVKGPTEFPICSIPYPFLPGKVKELGSLETESILIAQSTNLALLTSMLTLLRTYKEDKKPLELLVTLL